MDDLQVVEQLERRHLCRFAQPFGKILVLQQREVQLRVRLELANQVPDSVLRFRITKLTFKRK